MCVCSVSTPYLSLFISTFSHGRCSKRSGKERARADGRGGLHCVSRLDQHGHLCPSLISPFSLSRSSFFLCSLSLSISCLIIGFLPFAWIFRRGVLFDCFFFFPFLPLPPDIFSLPATSIFPCFDLGFCLFHDDEYSVGLFSCCCAVLFLPGEGC